MTDWSKSTLTSPKSVEVFPISAYDCPAPKSFPKWCVVWKVFIFITSSSPESYRHLSQQESNLFREIVNKMILRDKTRKSSFTFAVSVVKETCTGRWLYEFCSSGNEGSFKELWQSLLELVCTITMPWVIIRSERNFYFSIYLLS